MLISLMPGALAWPAAMIVWGPGFTSTLHRHHCVHLLMAVHGTLRIRGGARQRWLCCGAALVQADAAHEVDARDATVLIAFIEPESTLGAALSHRTRHRTRGGTRTGALAPRHRPGSHAEQTARRSVGQGQAAVRAPAAENSSLGQPGCAICTSGSGQVRLA